MEQTLAFLRSSSRRLMASVPKYAQVRPGVGVNIVLKADQRTGKLTTGRVADILTRHDHPRGIKVRMQDGQIGRVQSLTSGGGAQGQSRKTVGGGGLSEELASSSPQVREPARGTKLQEDYRNDPVPVESRSLEDYIKKPTQNKKKTQRKTVIGPPIVASGGESVATEPEALNEDVQGKLEREFTQLDPALIAAIVADYKQLEEARKVLQELG